MRRVLYLRVSLKDAGKPVKELLRRRWSFSAAMLVELKRREHGICLNGVRVPVNSRVCSGDLLSVDVGDLGADSGFTETQGELSILYEDSDLIIVNKPAFLAVHPSKGHVDDTLANLLAFYYHQQGESFVFRCVLRLDRNTSGAVLIAKNAYAHDSLRRQLASGMLKKEYTALVCGQPPFHRVIDAPIWKPPEATLRRTVDERGKPSRTEFFLEKSNGAVSLLRVIPYTGRTHQIRLHLSDFGFPVVSDFLYGREDGILSRHGLHCSKLSFFHPVTGRPLVVSAPLAPDMEAIAARLPEVQRFYSLDRYLKTVYGEKLVKVPLQGGMSCPNRDGTLGTGGCLFCSVEGSGEFCPNATLSVPQQLTQAKMRLNPRLKGRRLIAYFQSYTNTYAPISRLRDLFSAAAEDPEVAVLSVATRPDCLPEAVLDLLEQQNRRKTVWVELGLQTSCESTAEAFHRGYSNKVYEMAATVLRSRGIYVITHLIFGLPGENLETMLSSVSYAATYSDGLKLQMLQILKTSGYEKIYRESPFPLMSLDEYTDTVCESIRILPPSTVLHRLTGDPDRRLLLAPDWTADKKRVLAQIRKKLEDRDIVQGDKLSLRNFPEGSV